jgi:hypothetical protein
MWTQYSSIIKICYDYRSPTDLASPQMAKVLPLHLAFLELWLVRIIIHKAMKHTFHVYKC